MKKNRGLFCIFLSIIVCFSFLVSCKQDVPEVPVTGISIVGTGIKDKTLTVMKGSRDITLTAVVRPSNATDKTVIWNSSNKEVVTISQSGVLSIIDEGKASITATAGNHKDTLQVIVNAPVLIDTMSFKEEDYNITVIANNIASLDLSGELIINPENVTNKTVTFSISPSDEFISINAQGLLTVSDQVNHETTYVVTATSVAQSGITATTQITLSLQTPEDISIRLTSDASAKPSGHIYRFSISDKQFVNLGFAAELKPVGSFGDIVFSSNNASVVDINSTTGIIEIKEIGTAIITATCGNISKSINLEITDAVDYLLNDLNLLESELQTETDYSNYWNFETNPAQKPGSIWYCSQVPIPNLGIGMFYADVDGTGWNAKMMPNQGNGAYIEDGGWCCSFTQWDWPYDNNQTNNYIFNKIHIPDGANTFKFQVRTLSAQYSSGKGKFRVRLVDLNNFENQVFLNINGQLREGFNAQEDRQLEDLGIYDPVTGWVTIDRVADFTVGEDYYYMVIPDEWMGKDVLVLFEVDDIHQDGVTGLNDLVNLVKMYLTDYSNTEDAFSTQ